MRRTKGTPHQKRGNSTPPARTAAAPQAVAPAEPLPRSGSRMSPRNWRVRTRLNAILLIPVVVALVFGGLRVNSSIDTWREAQDAERVARLVQTAAAYAYAVMNERDVTAAPLLTGDEDSNEVAQARDITDEAQRTFHAQLQDIPDTAALKRRIKHIEEAEAALPKLRDAAYTSKLKNTEEQYALIYRPLMALTNELGLGTSNITSFGRTLYAVALTESAASLDRAIGMHLLVMDKATDEQKAQVKMAFASYARLEAIAVEEFRFGGRPQDGERLDALLEEAKAKGEEQITETAEKAKAAGQPFKAPPPITEMITAMASPLATKQSLAAQGITAKTWWASSTAKFEVYRQVEKEIAAGAVNEADAIATDARRDTFVNAGIAVGALFIAFLVAAVMARQMGRSLRRLRNAAFGVAEQRLPMLVDQLSRTDPGQVDTRVKPIPVNSRDEVGEVARAFDQVHREAVRLAAEQALLRGNLNAIFTNLSHRNQGLIERQLELISSLEEGETDPEHLENLFQMDHLSTRMRRNGENLLVLAGQDTGRQWDEPVPLLDVLRAATSEVESYERIEVTGVPDCEIHGVAVTDLVHLLAELLENATTFSSPHTKVRVTATRLPDRRVMIEIHDKGIGLTAEDFADINHRLANPPAVDAAISQRMGLFVVGRLSDRHGIRVQLRPSGEQSGTTSLVMLPEAITFGGAPEAAPEEEFTVSRIIADRPSFQAHQPPQAPRGPGGFGFDGYAAPGQDRDTEILDPVSRSLAREERRAALEAKVSRGKPLFRDETPALEGGSGGLPPGDAMPQQPSYDPTPQQPSYDPMPQQPSYDANGRTPLPRRTDNGMPAQPQHAPGAPAGPVQPVGFQPLETGDDNRWERAAGLRAPQTGGTTSSGLPKRVPRANLVEGAATQTPQGGPQVSRSPEDVRGRLSNLRRGVEQGRGHGQRPDQNDSSFNQGSGPGSTYDQER
ncbi:nitrate- and nitrite sensing domain-containing protein [Streptomyces sp. NPDC051940]|uniref:nitrate- and nitrite sensing domain-containing protein n=1 Tax=Streptomyces sp. NPDC051940 TaxID=3155675 RepID=UPI003412C363